jgi:hypothetical protein
MSSPDRTLGSWVRIPLKAYKSVCVYSVFELDSGVAVWLDNGQSLEGTGIFLFATRFRQNLVLIHSPIPIIRGNCFPRGETAGSCS